MFQALVMAAAMAQPTQVQALAALALLFPTPLLLPAASPVLTMEAATQTLATLIALTPSLTLPPTMDPQLG